MILPRILLIEPSRYQALLIERELIDRMPSAMIVKYSDAQLACGELGRAGYTLVIVNGSIPDLADLMETFCVQHPEVRCLVGLPQSLRPTEVDRITRLADLTVPAGENVPEEIAEAAVELIGITRPDALTSGRPSALINLMTGTLAHEINNPLMTILGNTELLLEHPDSPSADWADKIRTIESQALRIRTILDDLSHLARPTIRRTVAGELIEHDQAKPAR